MRLIDLDETIKDLNTIHPNYKAETDRFIRILKAQPLVQPSFKYSSLSKDEFQEWLYKHGIKEVLTIEQIPIIIDLAVTDLFDEDEV